MTTSSDPIKADHSDNNNNSNSNSSQNDNLRHSSPSSRSPQASGLASGSTILTTSSNDWISLVRSARNNNNDNSNNNRNNNNNSNSSNNNQNRKRSYQVLDSPAILISDEGAARLEKEIFFEWKFSPVLNILARFEATETFVIFIVKVTYLNVLHWAFQNFEDDSENDNDDDNDNGKDDDNNNNDDSDTDDDNDDDEMNWQKL